MSLTLEKEISINCLDCRGVFTVPEEEFKEEEVIECSLCSAEMVVLSEESQTVKMFCEDDDF